MNAKKYLTKCRTCGGTTSKSYARKTNGLCKPCHTGEPRPAGESNEHRNARMLDAGWNAYAREEGHYDTPY